VCKRAPQSAGRKALIYNIFMYIFRGFFSVISVQVFNQVTHVCRRKIAMSWSEIDQFLALVRGFCTLVPLTEATYDEAAWILSTQPRI